MSLHAATSDASAGLSWLGPVLLFAGAVVVALINAGAIIWRRHQDKQDATAAVVISKQMTESEEDTALSQARQEATKYYNHYTTFRGLFYDVQQALRHLVRKLRDAHPDMNLDQDVVDALALKPEYDDSKQ